MPAAASKARTTPTGETRPARKPPAARRDDELRRSFWRWGRIAFMVIAVYYALQLVGIARGIAGTLLGVLLCTGLGFVVALLCSPLRNLLSRRTPMSDGFAAFVSLALFVATIAGVFYFVASPLLVQSRQIMANLGNLNRPFATLQVWLAERGIQTGGVSLDALIGGNNHLNNFFVQQALTGGAAIATGIAITLITAFWLLRDHVTLRQALLQTAPATWRPHIVFVLEATAVVVGGYARAQLLLAALLGVCAGIGCALIGVPFPLVVGVATGVFELVPLIGAFAGAAVASILALTRSPSLVIGTLALFLVLHLVEGYVLAPRLQAKFVRLHPLVAFIALLVGLEADGILGGLVAVPLASLAAVLLRASVGDWQANRPELFVAPRQVDKDLLGRRRSLLRQYRIFKRPPRPGQRVREVVSSVKETVTQNNGKS